MLPEWAPQAAPPRLPALHLESLVAARLRDSQKCLDRSDDSKNVQPIPARLTPRGSLIPLTAITADTPLSPETLRPQSGTGEAPETPERRCDHRVVPPETPLACAAKTQLGKDGEQNSLLIRAQAAEQEVRKARMDNKKLEGDVRKLRADAYFQRIGKNLHGARGVTSQKTQEMGHSSSAQDESSADAWAARLLAEERAVKAESEVLRLQTELQAAMIQFSLISDHAGTTTMSEPPPETISSEETPQFQMLPCCRDVCGCLRFYLFPVLCVFWPGRSSRQHSKMVDEKSETPDIKGFCVSGRT